MRLDLCLYERGLVKSRTEAKKLVLARGVAVNGATVDKPSYEVSDGDEVSVVGETCRYVSRGGYKLEGALDGFGISVEGRLALDVGASSGGFTDCLLQRGAAGVAAVDSGSGQMAESLRRDSRVTVMERFNARYMTAEEIPFSPSLIVMDVSFISATIIIPAVYNVAAVGADFICLVKPQFEVGRSGIGKGGIVKSDKLRLEALEKVIDSAVAVGFSYKGHIVSPIRGGDGNIEFLVHFVKGETS